MSFEPLTIRQQEVLEFIMDYWFAHGFPPPLIATCERFDYGTASAVTCHLRALVKKGYLRRAHSVHKGQRKTVYTPVLPVADVRGNGRGGVLLGTVGGPVSFTPAEWEAWLREQLAVVESFA